MTKLERFKGAVLRDEPARVTGEPTVGGIENIKAAYGRLKSSDRLLALAWLQDMMKQSINEMSIQMARFFLIIREECVGGKR